MSLNFASYLANGYTADQILQFVERAFPNIAKAARSAQKAGKSAEEIVRVIAQLDAKQLKKADKKAEVLNYDNPLERANAAARDDSGNPILQGLQDVAKVAGPAAGIYGIARGLPVLANSGVGQNLLSHLGLGSQSSEQQAAPGQFQSTISPSQSDMPVVQPQAGVSIPPTGLPQILGQGKPQEIASAPAQAPQPSPPQTVRAQQPPELDSVSIIQELGLEEKINNYLKNGETPEYISSQVVPSLNPKQRKLFTEKVKTGQAPTMQSIIRDYASKVPASSMQIAPVAPQSTQMQTDKLDVQPASKKTLSKGSVVATPQGFVGSIESERNGQALVKDESGKLHKTKVDDLIESPLPEKDLADLFDDVVKGIEHETGEEVSRNVNWAGYDPESKTLAYRPHLGAFYVYDDISPEQAEVLTSMLTNRKTSGENFIGAWKEGSKSPIGAAMYALIKQLQAERGGKGKEYANKFLTLYDALGPAAEASKKKKKAKK